MPFQLVETDITTVEVDVIVNAANEQLREGGGVCGAIFKAAGATQLQKACDEIGHCQTGEAVMTDAFQLPSKKIIHTVGPVWQGGIANEADLLRGCYHNSLTLAEEKGYESIAFPLISSGIFGYPWEQALNIAVSTILNFLKTSEMAVYLVIFDKEKLFHHNPILNNVSSYIDASFEERERIRHELQSSQVVYSRVAESMDLMHIVDQLDVSFAESLFALIDDKGMTDVEAYKKANIDRRLFSKIKNNPDYTPSKKTVLSFAIALELELEETQSLLEKVGYTLSKSNKFDLIIRYFIEQSSFDVFKINEALFAFDQELLGI